MKRHYQEHPEARDAVRETWKQKVAQDPKTFDEGRRKGVQVSVQRRIPDSILELSSRTVRKVLIRLGMGCSRCGWCEGTSDLHHIQGRKVPNPDSHDNLAYICPNCHRLVHERKVAPEELIPFSTYIGDRWKDYYFGMCE
ncbi:MAG: hypothetical protein A2Y38_02305 [Spirochaetes bacterium GWB1_59_5]|nr:MAG: hypothetical protein A2Y38_02305 [Spirochaetes bacterium GWB1_59_5]